MQTREREVDFETQGSIHILRLIFIVYGKFFLNGHWDSDISFIPQFRRQNRCLRMLKFDLDEREANICHFEKITATLWCHVICGRGLKHIEFAF